MATQNKPSSATLKPYNRSNRKLLYGTTHVVEPKGEHRATVVWLHGRGDKGVGWAKALQELPFENIKWIVPTAPLQKITALGGYCCSAWFDGRPVWEGPEDLEGLDASAAHVAELLSKEPSHIKLGVGGFSQGAATSLYMTACSMIGSYSDGTTFPCKLHVTAALSGWLPCVKNIRMRILESHEAGKQAKGYSLFLGHGTNDDSVSLKLGENSNYVLESFGFDNITFKSYKGLGHGTNVSEMEDLHAFFKQWLHSQG